MPEMDLPASEFPPKAAVGAASSQHSIADRSWHFFAHASTAMGNMCADERAKRRQRRFDLHMSTAAPMCAPASSPITDIRHLFGA